MNICKDTFVYRAPGKEKHTRGNHWPFIQNLVLKKAQQTKVGSGTVNSLINGHAN